MIVISAKEVMFMFLPMSVCWLVYQHDYTKCTEQIYTKLGWRIGLCSEQTPFLFNSTV